VSLGRSEKQQEILILAERVRENALRNEEAQNLLKEIGDLEASITRYNRLAWPVRVTDVVDKIASLVPPSATLTALALIPREEQQPKHSKKSSNKESAQSLGQSYLVVELEGVTASDIQIAEIVSGLEASQLFSNVVLDFARAQQIGAQEGRAFRVTARVDLNRRYLFVDATSSEVEP